MVVISLSMMSELRIVLAAYADVPPSATNNASQATAFCRMCLESLRSIGTSCRSVRPSHRMLGLRLGGAP